MSFRKKSEKNQTIFKEKNWPSVCDLLRKRVLALGWSDGLASWASSARCKYENEGATQKCTDMGLQITCLSLCWLRAKISLKWCNFWSMMWTPPGWNSALRAWCEPHRPGAPCRWCAAGRSQCLHSRPRWWWWDTPPAPPPSCGSWDSLRERCSKTPILPSLTRSSPATAGTVSHTSEEGSASSLTGPQGVCNLRKVWSGSFKSGSW